MPVDSEQLKADAAEMKARASRASEDLMRAQKEIGSLQDQAKRIPELEDALAVKDAELDQLKAEKKSLESALNAANKVNADNAVKVEAAETIKKGLAAL